MNSNFSARIEPGQGPLADFYQLRMILNGHQVIGALSGPDASADEIIFVAESALKKLQAIAKSVHIMEEPNHD